MKLPRLVSVLFALPWIIVAFGVGWLVLLRFPPSGVFHASSDVDGKSAWIMPFLPALRTTSPGVQADGWTGQRITADPVYFTVHAPGPYEKVDVSMEFRPIRQPLADFGIVRDAAGQDLELQPMYSSELASAAWTPVISGAMSGYVKQGTLPVRLSNPDTRGLAVWDATASWPNIADPPGPSVKTVVSLRGSHDFWIVPDGHVHMTFTLQAVNRTTGGDVAAIRVFRDDTEISRETVTLSGSRDATMGAAFTHTVDVPNADVGIYRISITAQDDVFIRAIETDSRRWVVGPRLVFGDLVGYSATTSPAIAWTNSRHIVAETFHVEGLQQVDLGPTSGRIPATHTQIRLDRTDDITTPVELSAEKGDVRFVGDGFFALRQDAFFEPRPRRMSDGTQLERDGITAVLTPYTRPQALGDGWYRYTGSFTVDPTLDNLRFVVSAPGLMARAGAIDIRKIDLTFHRQAVTFGDWWKILRQELANAWHRL